MGRASRERKRERERGRGGITAWGRRQTGGKAPGVRRKHQEEISQKSFCPLVRQVHKKGRRRKRSRPDVFVCAQPSVVFSTWWGLVCARAFS